MVRELSLFSSKTALARGSQRDQEPCCTESRGLVDSYQQLPTTHKAQTLKAPGSEGVTKAPGYKGLLPKVQFSHGSTGSDGSEGSDGS